MPSAREKRWSLGSARALVPEVRRHTETAVKEVEELESARDALATGAPERAALERRIRQAIDRWVRAMDALGLEVKGLWLVDFDNGSGYYCWQWPEDELAYFHGYEDGFAGRVRIQ